MAGKPPSHRTSSQDLAAMSDPTPLKVLPRRDLTDRQVLRLTHRVAVRTLSRYSHLCAAYSVGWNRCNRWLGVDSAPLTLHPYQFELLDWVLRNRRRGEVWLKKALQTDPALTFAAWQKQQNSQDQTA